MQPYFFPYISYFQLIAAVDKFVIFDDVNYINRGWINRNNILVGGKSTLLTLPLQEASQNKKIDEIQVTADVKVLEKMMKTIVMSYKKAPYFASVHELIQELFSSSTSSIAEFNLNQLKTICRYLEVDTEFVNSSRQYNNERLKGEERIIDICLKESTDVYINPIGGTELYEPAKFETTGIKLYFLKTRPFEYRQFNHPFVPWLSIIDVLMFNSKERILSLLENYDLQ